MAFEISPPNFVLCLLADCVKSIRAYNVKSSSTLSPNIIRWDFKISSSFARFIIQLGYLNLYWMCKLFLSLLYHRAVFVMVIIGLKMMVTIVMCLPIGHPGKQKMARSEGSLSTGLPTLNKYFTLLDTLNCKSGYCTLCVFTCMQCISTSWLVIILLLLQKCKP